MSRTYRGMRLGAHTEVWVTGDGPDKPLPNEMFFGPFCVDRYDWGAGMTLGVMQLTADVMADVLGTATLSVWSVALVAEELFSRIAPGPWVYTLDQLTMDIARYLDVSPVEKCYTREVAGG